MNKLLASIAAFGLCALSVQAEAKSAAAAQAQANAAAVRLAAIAVVQTKGAAAAVADLKSAIDVVRVDVAAVKADTSATQDQIAAARFEAIATVLTVKQLKAIIAAAKKGGR